MNNEKYNQIVDAAYGNYKKHIETQQDIQKEEVKRLRSQGKLVKVGRINLLSREEFINKCKTDPEFSKRCRLKIEERELSQRERVKLLQESWKNNGIGAGDEEVSTLWVEYNNLMTKYNIPSKLITVTYKDEKIEIYE